VLKPGSNGFDIRQAGRRICSDKIVTPDDDSRLRLKPRGSAGEKESAKKRPKTFLSYERCLAL
jgi:hypothetical protein